MTDLLFAWGKTDEDGRPAHHLAHHCMDVAAVFEQLLDHPIICARVRSAVGRSISTAERTWLASFVFLHDIGKLSPGFQAKAWAPASSAAKGNHLIDGWYWMIWRFGRDSNAYGEVIGLLLGDLREVCEATHGQWLHALFAHHGRPVTPGANRPLGSLPSYDLGAEEQAVTAALDAWFHGPSIGVDVLESVSMVHLFAGLLALADWIGSDQRSFPLEAKLDVTGYGKRSRQRSATAVRQIGLLGSPWPVQVPSFFALTGHISPRGVQEIIADLPVETPLAIIEAETGSGKTEAALWHFARMRSAGLVDALYFAVPTRAAASQLHRRVNDAMVRIGGPEAILAVPGQLLAGMAEGIKLPGFEVRWDDGGKRWAAEHATRFLCASVAVGTVDQILMAGLQVKHAHLRGAALSRSLLVIDEVHASDVYMNRVANTLVRAHLRLGGKALLMSATLGASVRSEWLGMPMPNHDEAVAQPYPVVWSSDSPNKPIEVYPSMSGSSKTVMVRCVATMDSEQTASLAIGAARNGARVLVVRNTVNAAVDTWKAITAVDPSLCLDAQGGPAVHHSRFAVEDRRLLDVAIESAFGKQAQSKGIIACGSQTLEQSLDIDADVLVTDLCPMDVLLQRIGRLHRHERERPSGFEIATVHVLCPQGGVPRLVTESLFEHGLGGWRSNGVLTGIYLDTRVVEATRRLLDAQPLWKIPEDNRRLVEGATHPEVLEGIVEELGWQKYAAELEGSMQAETQHGAMLSLDRARPFPGAFPDVDESVQTRLGARGVVAELPSDIIGPFGTSISRIALPAHWSQGLSGQDGVVTETTSTGTLRLSIGDKQFVYDRSGVWKEPKRGNG